MKYLKTILFIAFLASTALNGRDNPFIPTQINAKDMNTSNVKNELAPLKSISLNLPSDARELVRVLFVYKGVDGVLRSYNVNAPYSINWQDDLILSTQEKIKTNTQNPPTKMTKTAEQNATKSPQILATKETKQSQANSIRELIGNNASKYTGEQISTLSTKQSIKVSFAKRLFIENFSDKIILKTADKMLRYDIKYEKNKAKIVIDFAKRARDYATQTNTFENIPVNSLIIGSHGKFYRVVLYLNSNYKTTLNKGKNSYILRLNK